MDRSCYYGEFVFSPALMDEAERIEVLDAMTDGLQEAPQETFADGGGGLGGFELTREGMSFDCPCAYVYSDRVHDALRRVAERLMEVGVDMRGWLDATQYTVEGDCEFAFFAQNGKVVEVSRPDAPEIVDPFEPTEDKAIELARRIYALPSDNDIEIDDEPKTSRGEDGVWVAAWVFVSKEALGESDEDEDEED